MFRHDSPVVDRVGPAWPGRRVRGKGRAPADDAGGERAARLAFAALLGQGEAPAGVDAVANERTSISSMKRVQDIAWPVIGLGAVAVSSWLLFRELRGLSLASLREAFASISPAAGSLAIGSTSLAYAALAWYDQIALSISADGSSWRFVGLASFTTYAIAHNIGASVLSGAVIRYRAYSTKGLSVGEVGVLVAFCSFTFALGVATVGGLLLLFRPELVERLRRGAAVARAGGRRSC